MNRTARNSLLAVLAAASLGLGASIAQAQTSIPLNRVYVIDQRGEVVMSGAGLCWRTGFWTPAAAANDPAGCKCDKDLLPKEVCEPPGTEGCCCDGEAGG
jgi:OOP family OmpA-OmpF porin